ncbi:MAG: hypothetical protein FWD40_11265 [Treponema sp.]|nr:hypothetical protein [Treponema sp.]
MKIKNKLWLLAMIALIGITAGNLYANPVAGLYAKAPPIAAGDTPIAGLRPNNIFDTISHINSNPGTYTMLVDQNFEDPTRTFSGNRNINLTIMGIGEGRFIQTGSSSGPLFRITNPNATLTFMNITLRGHQNHDGFMIYVQDGTLIMGAGSRITGHTTRHTNGAVAVGNAMNDDSNANFVMDGGEISGNISTSDRDTATGGINIGRGGSLTMRSGSITGNFRNTNVPADLTVAARARTITRQGGTIGAITDQRQ